MNPFEYYCDLVKYGKIDYQDNPKRWHDSWQDAGIDMHNVHRNEFDVGDEKYESTLKSEYGSKYDPNTGYEPGFDNLISDFSGLAPLPVKQFSFARSKKSLSGVSRKDYRISSTGNAKEVFNKAASSLLGGMDKYKIPALFYTSEESEPSRKKLYDFLTPKINEFNNNYEPYIIDDSDESGNFKYALIHKDFNDTFNDLAKKYKVNAINLRKKKEIQPEEIQPEKAKREETKPDKIQPKVKSNPFWNFLTKGKK